MSDLIPENSSAAGLIARVQAILLKPNDTWTVIDGESDSMQSLYMRYIIPLAAIGPIAGAIGMVAFGIPIPFIGTMRLGIGASLAIAVTGFIGSLVSVYVLSLIIDMLAPSFGGTKNGIKAFQVSTYASTAAWVAGILRIFPLLGILGSLLGLYSLYLLVVGAPKLMKVPQDRSVGYIVVTIVVAIVVFIIIGYLTGMITGPLMAPTLGSMMSATN
ncbi:MAG: hypothetical protein RL367_2438 [Pseudomonadota bacterium]